MFQVNTQTCSFCKGKKVVEVLEVWHPDSCEWVRIPKVCSETLYRIVTTEKTRWVDSECPNCGGSGEYQVEFVPCKIF